MLLCCKLLLVLAAAQPGVPHHASAPDEQVVSLPGSHHAASLAEWHASFELSEPETSDDGGDDRHPADEPPALNVASPAIRSSVLIAHSLQVERRAVPAKVLRAAVSTGLPCGPPSLR